MSHNGLNDSVMERLKDETAQIVPPTTQTMLAGINAGLPQARKKARLQRTIRGLAACAAVLAILVTGVFFAVQTGLLGEGDEIGLLSPGEVALPSSNPDADPNESAPHDTEINIYAQDIITPPNNTFISIAEPSWFFAIPEDILRTELRVSEFMRHSSYLDEAFSEMSIVEGQIIYVSVQWRAFQSTLRDYAWARATDIDTRHHVAGRIDTITCGDFLECCGGYLFIEQNYGDPILQTILRGDPSWLADMWDPPLWIHHASHDWMPTEETWFLKLERHVFTSIKCSVCDFLERPFDTARLNIAYHQTAWHQILEPIF